jgi:hypothetical protein
VEFSLSFLYLSSRKKIIGMGVKQAMSDDKTEYWMGRPSLYRKVKKYGTDDRVGRLRSLAYKIRFFFRQGQKEYCVQCLPVHAPPYYPYWLINTRRATLKPIGDCKHK